MTQLDLVVIGVVVLLGRCSPCARLRARGAVDRRLGRRRSFAALYRRPSAAAFAERFVAEWRGSSIATYRRAAFLVDARSLLILVTGHLAQPCSTARSSAARPHARPHLRRWCAALRDRRPRPISRCPRCCRPARATGTGSPIAQSALLSAASAAAAPASCPSRCASMREFDRRTSRTAGGEKRDPRPRPADAAGERPAAPARRKAQRQKLPAHGGGEELAIRRSTA